MEIEYCKQCNHPKHDKICGWRIFDKKKQYLPKIEIEKSEHHGIYDGFSCYNIWKDSAGNIYRIDHEDILISISEKDEYFYLYNGNFKPNVARVAGYKEIGRCKCSLDNHANLDQRFILNHTTRLKFKDSNSYTFKDEECLNCGHYHHSRIPYPTDVEKETTDLISLLSPEEKNLCFWMDISLDDDGSNVIRLCPCQKLLRKRDSKSKKKRFSFLNFSREKESKAIQRVSPKLFTINQQCIVKHA